MEPKSRAPGRKAAPATHRGRWTEGVGGAICVAGLCVVLCEGGREGWEGRVKKSTVRTRAIKSQEEASQQTTRQDAFVPLSLYVLSAPLCVWVYACNACNCRMRSKKQASSLPRDNALLLFLSSPFSSSLPPPTHSAHHPQPQHRQQQQDDEAFHRHLPQAQAHGPANGGPPR